MPTVTELEQQLREAREAEAEQRRQAEAEKRREEKQAEIVLTDGYMQELTTKLSEAGIVCELRPGTLDGYKRYAEILIPDFGYGQDVKLDTRGGGSYTKPSYQITIGSYGNRRVYPLLKSGTFKYDAIVKDVKQRVEQLRRKAEYDKEREQKRLASAAILERLRQRFNLPEHSTVLDSCERNAEKVYLTLKADVSEEQAAAILKAAIETGVIK